MAFGIAEPSPTVARLRAPHTIYTEHGAKARASYGHVYIADGGFVPSQNGAVYRYPLGANGLPSQEPDLTLYGGLIHPFGLAFDERGNLYVYDSTSTVSVFPPGAQGNDKPIRSLSISPNTEGSDIALDHRGYLFAVSGDASGNANVINIYSPGASGNDFPLHTISFGTHGLVFDEVVDDSGRLYVELLAAPVEIFDHPVDQWQAPDQTLSSNGHEQYYLPLALDTRRAEVLIGYYPTPRHYNLRAFSVRRPNDTTYERRLLTGGCEGGTPYGAVVSGDYLLVSCSLGRWTAILAYKAHVYGRQKPVAVIGSGLLESPGSIRLGP